MMADGGGGEGICNGEGSGIHIKQEHIDHKSSSCCSPSPSSVQSTVNTNNMANCNNNSHDNFSKNCKV